MIRMLVTVLYGIGYLICSLPELSRVKKLDPRLSVEKRDEAAHTLPKNWAASLIRSSGSKVTVEGEHNMPVGPVLIVSNHQSNFDIPVLMSSLKKPAGFLSKTEVKKLPLLPKWMEVMNCIFVDRKNKRQAMLSLKEGSEKLKEGHSLIIFPEGTRSKGDDLAEFKTGALRMAAGAGVPIVPVAIDGTYDIMEKQGGWRFKPSQVKVIVCKPVQAEEYTGRDLKTTAEELRQTIAKTLRNPS
ncbi:lysophospholipid acyltransferase family protein [Metabacillus indicus]|uniref:lysophospholipid acyltransferase family protein n=1 Tax=Metabacillus indicus TaxID=246786 RepID=UPI002493C4B5|nr:lysophospholipid acyltransferase family protein [Metabacillus indicus]